MGRLDSTIVLGIVVTAATADVQHGWHKTGVVRHPLFRQASLGAAAVGQLMTMILSGLVVGTTFTSSSSRALLILALPGLLAHFNPFVPSMREE